MEATETDAQDSEFLQWCRSVPIRRADEVVRGFGRETHHLRQGLQGHGCGETPWNCGN